MLKKYKIFSSTFYYDNIINTSIRKLIKFILYLFYRKLNRSLLKEKFKRKEKTKIINFNRNEKVINLSIIFNISSDFNKKRKIIIPAGIEKKLLF